MSPARVVEWANAGADTMVLSDLYVSGPAAADFVVAEDLCGGATLSPGSRAARRSCSGLARRVPERRRSPSTGDERGDGGADGRGDRRHGGPPELAGLVRAVPETLDFGEQPVGVPAGPWSCGSSTRSGPGPVRGTAARRIDAGIPHGARPLLQRDPASRPRLHGPRPVRARRRGTALESWSCAT